MMLKRPPLGGLFFLLFLIISLSSRAEERLCPEVVAHTKQKLNFSDTERRMVCGDPKVKAYGKIPSYQAKFFMIGLLQSRGFLLPDFEVINGTLHVWPRGRARISEIHVVTGEEDLRKHVKDEILRKYKKKLLTPNTLNAIEKDGLSVVRRRGFPCTSIETEAIAAEKSVTLRFEDLIHHDFGRVERQEIEGLHENALARFYPFKEEDSYNERLLELTEIRMLRAGVVSGTYFLQNCSPDAEQFSLTQRFILGPLRAIRYGAGANTEEGPLARIKWSNNRYGHMASILSASLQASFRIQALNLSAGQFLWPSNPRQSLFSQFDLVRESQFDYLQSVARFRPHMKWTEDKLSRHWAYTLGPTFEAGAFRFEERLKSRSYKNLAFEGSLSWDSHPYEVYDILPQEGDTFEFKFDFRGPELGFESKLLRLSSNFATLGQVGTWERGAMILGARLIGGATFVPAEVPLIDLPPSVKFYGGGSDDIRGFLLRTLPKNDGLGAFSKTGIKLELRRTYFFKESLECFAFVDAARFGEKSWILERRIWYSPGVGLRWYSPIGMVQGYAARARATHPAENFGNFYFMGLGGAF